MIRVITAYGLYEALKDEGFELPKECADVELVMPVDGIFKLRLIVNMTDVTLPQLGRALIRLSEQDGLRPVLKAK